MWVMVVSDKLQPLSIWEGQHLISIFRNDIDLLAIWNVSNALTQTILDPLQKNQKHLKIAKIALKTDQKFFEIL